MQQGKSPTAEILDRPCMEKNKTHLAKSLQIFSFFFFFNTISTNQSLLSKLQCYARWLFSYKGFDLSIDQVLQDIIKVSLAQINRVVCSTPS